MWIASSDRVLVDLSFYFPYADDLQLSAGIWLKSYELMLEESNAVHPPFALGPVPQFVGEGLDIHSPSLHIFLQFSLPEIAFIT